MNSQEGKFMKEYKLRVTLHATDIFEELKSSAMRQDYAIEYYIESVLQEVHRLKREWENG